MCGLQVAAVLGAAGPRIDARGVVKCASRVGLVRVQEFRRNNVQRCNGCGRTAPKAEQTLATGQMDSGQCTADGGGLLVQLDLLSASDDRPGRLFTGTDRRSAVHES